MSDYSERFARLVEKYAHELMNTEDQDCKRIPLDEIPEKARELALRTLGEEST
jgi:hypothetical protein